MLISTTPGSLVWPAAMLVWGPGAASAGHRHHAVQLILAMEGTLRARGKAGERWMQCEAALIRADTSHEVDARGTSVLIAFVDPESALGTALAERVTDDIACVPADDVSRWRAALGGETIDQARVESWLTHHLLRRPQSDPIDPRVRRVLGYVREHLGSPEELSLPKLARVANLSASRFLHVFTESVGVPPRPYLLWLRLQRAAGELTRGSSVTHAAHEAGFADAAHLTRTCRRMLGATPSEMTRRVPEARGFAVSGAHETES